MLKKGNFAWISGQVYKFLAIKYLNRIWPEKIFSGPMMGVIIITYRCNSNCPMCGLSKRGNLIQELSTGEMKQLIDDFAAIGTSGLSFTGGEPLLRDDIFFLIKYANQKGMATTLNTNSLLLNQKKIGQLLEACPDNVNISLDGADPVGYDRLRGTKNGLAKLKKTVSLLVKERNKRQVPMTLTAVTTIAPGNINKLQKISRLAKNLGFDKIGFNPLHQIGKRVSAETKELHDQNVFQKMISLKKEGVVLDNSQEFLRMFDRAFRGQPFPLRCLAGYTSLFVDCYGDVFFCWPEVELGKRMVNLKTKRLAAVWQDAQYAKMRRKMLNCGSCFWNCQAELSILFQ